MCHLANVNSLSVVCTSAANSLGLGAERRSVNSICISVESRTGSNQINRCAILKAKE